MITKKKYYGPKQELIDYIYKTYKIVPRTKESIYSAGTSFDGYEGFTIKDQINKIDEEIKTGTGLIFFLHVKSDIKMYEGSNIEMELKKIWIHIREVKEEDTWNQSV